MEARRMWLSIYIWCLMDRNSPISGKQTDMLSVGSLERLRVLSAEPNSLLEKPVGLLQEKMQPSVCVVFQKFTFLHSQHLSFLENIEHLTNTSLSVCWGQLMASVIKVQNSFVSYGSFCLIELYCPLAKGSSISACPHQNIT